MSRPNVLWILSIGFLLAVSLGVNGMPNADGDDPDSVFGGSEKLLSQGETWEHIPCIDRIRKIAEKFPGIEMNSETASQDNDRYIVRYDIVQFVEDIPDFVVRPREIRSAATRSKLIFVTEDCEDLRLITRPLRGA